MNSFRTALVAVALLVSSYALASTFAELTTSDSPPFPSDPTNIDLSPDTTASNWLEAISPFRSDLESKLAIVDALQTVQSGKEQSTSGQSARNDKARARARRSLSVAPYSPDLWLALALLEAQHDARGPALVEALKMAYFTGPNDARLMPVRLDTATLFDALADPDLKELVRGDLRLMITRQPDLKAAVVSAYRRASNRGKAFLEEAIQSIDSSFLATIHG